LFTQLAAYADPTSRIPQIRFVHLSEYRVTNLSEETMSVVYATPYSSPATTLLSQWGNTIVGNWSLKSSSFGGTGTFTAAWNSTKTALNGTFEMTGFPSAAWITSVDSSGNVVQNQIDSNGTTAKITITGVVTSAATATTSGGGTYSTATTCNTSAAGAVSTIGSSNTFVTVSSDGNTMTHQLSNQVSYGQMLPNAAIIFTRV
jgi:hypothetical protein